MFLSGSVRSHDSQARTAWANQRPWYEKGYAMTLVKYRAHAESTKTTSKRGWLAHLCVWDGLEGFPENHDMFVIQICDLEMRAVGSVTPKYNELLAGLTLGLRMSAHVFSLTWVQEELFEKQ